MCRTCDTDFTAESQGIPEAKNRHIQQSNCKARKCGDAWEVWRVLMVCDVRKV